MYHLQLSSSPRVRQGDAWGDGGGLEQPLGAPTSAIISMQGAAWTWSKARTVPARGNLQS